MPQIGWFEILIIAAIAIIVVGPKDFPVVLKKIGSWIGSVKEGVLSVFRHFGLFLRSSVLGTVIGAIPGVGSSVAGFVAYGHASQTAADRSRFGQGDIRGVLAPEAANDAKDGGALIPTLALGIPGGTRNRHDPIHANAM